MVTSVEAEEPPQSQAHPLREKLAGVDAVVDECRTFCLASFAIHATKDRVNGGARYSCQVFGCRGESRAE